MEDRAQIHIRS